MTLEQARKNNTLKLNIINLPINGNLNQINKPKNKFIIGEK